MKSWVAGVGTGLLAAMSVWAADPEVLFQDPPDALALWRSNAGPDMKVTAGESGAPAAQTLNIEYRFERVDTGNAWPQVSRKLTSPLALDGDDVYVEFDCLWQPEHGKQISIRVLPQPQREIIEKLFKPVAGQWTAVRLPLEARKPGVKLAAIGFVIARRTQRDGDSGAFQIRNLRIVRAQKFTKTLDADGKPVQPGIISRKCEPAGNRTKDNRLEIEIPNLLVNGYFREGGTTLPPVGWMSYGKESYGESRHDGRSIHLPGVDGQATVALRQNGIVMVPGERYRLSGYIRGGGFTGAMNGHIGIACDNWSKIRAYNFTDKDIRNDWQYFEVVFTPDVSKAREYEMIVYRTGAGGGWIEVDRLILEGISEKALKNSHNKYAADQFAEQYAKARSAGTFRTGPPSPDYELVWADEFDGPEVDERNWKIYDMYRDSKRLYRLVPDAISFDGQGCIQFTTRRAADGRVEQPRISSTGHRTFTYGYFECRFELHDSNLANASFWMLPEGAMDPYDPVHKGMEIDIMESITPSHDQLSHTTHWYNTDPKTGKLVSFSGGTRARTAPGLGKGFHTVALEWLPDALIFYIDGVESWRLNAKDHPIPVNPHNIIFSFGGRNNQIAAQPGFSTTWKVDYIRVYQKKAPASAK